MLVATTIVRSSIWRPTQLFKILDSGLGPPPRPSSSLGVLQPGRAPRAAATPDGVVPHRGVVVGQLFTRLDPPGRADPDRLVHDLEPAVGLAGVVDEAGDIAVDGRVA